MELGPQISITSPQSQYDLRKVSGLQVWLRHGFNITLNADTGSVDVSSWGDQSSNNNHAVQTVFDRQPGYSNGNVDFDGVDDRLELGTVLNLGTFTICVVVDLAAGSPTNETILGNSANDFIRVRQGADVDRVFMKANAVAMNQTNLTADVPTTKFLFTITRSDSATTNNVVVRMNAAVVTDTSADDSDVSDAFDVGTIATAGGALTPLQGLINEVCIFNEVVSAANLADIEHDLMWRNGLL
tara:strand:- start:474 stop:1199 length:726 start_codon:yes stop_codon:yes gene_type:complete